MTTSPPYGLLLISGSQTHQENYARAFADDPRCRLIGLTDEADVSDRRRQLNQQLAQELNVPYFEDLDSAILRDDVDLVCVCPDPERRGRIAAKCARAGKHVYVDKPLTSSVADAQEVVAAVKENNVRSQMFSLVRSPASQRARHIVESGRLGTLVGLHCELLFAKGIAGTADLSTPRVEKPQAERFTFIDSKRELFCVGLYPLVLFQWLTGKRFVDVYGTTSNYFFAEHQRNDVEDFSCLSMKMEEDINATITVGRAGWQSHPSHGIHQIHLIGTKDCITIDAFRPRLEIHSDATAWTQPKKPHPEDPMGFWSSTQESGGVISKTDWFPVNSTIQSDATYFLDCIEQEIESDVAASVGAHAVEVIMSAYESSATRESVSV